MFNQNAHVAVIESGIARPRMIAVTNACGTELDRRGLQDGGAAVPQPSG
jgi:hypothetical protein